MMFPNFITARRDNGAQAGGHSEWPWQSPAHTLRPLTLGGRSILAYRPGSSRKGGLVGNEARRRLLQQLHPQARSSFLFSKSNSFCTRHAWPANLCLQRTKAEKWGLGVGAAASPAQRLRMGLNAHVPGNSLCFSYKPPPKQPQDSELPCKLQAAQQS